MDLNNIGYKGKPFVLAKDVTQVFYVKDMSTKSKRGKNNNDPINELTKETSSELKTSQTYQKIMKRMTEFHPS